MAKRKSLPKRRKMKMTDTVTIWELLYQELTEAMEKSIAIRSRLYQAEILSPTTVATVEEEVDAQWKLVLKETVLRTAAVFVGARTSFVDYAGWDVGALAQSLRKVFAFDILALPDKARQEAQADSGAILFAISKFFTEGFKVISETEQGGVVQLCDDSVIEYVIRWTELLLDKKMTEEEKKEILAWALDTE